MNDSISFLLACALGIVIGVNGGQFVNFTNIANKIDDLKYCNVYAAEGVMSSSHDFIKLDDIKYGVNKSDDELDFEFFVLGTEEASVYLSPEPIGGFGDRRGYGILVDETIERNSSLVIRKYEPKKANFDLKITRDPKIMFIGEVFQVNVQLIHQNNEVKICVLVDKQLISCAVDKDPILGLSYVTFFSDARIVNYNFYNCSHSYFDLSSDTREDLEYSEIWLPIMLLISAALFFLIFFQGYRYCRATKHGELLRGVEFSLPTTS